MTVKSFCGNIDASVSGLSQNELRLRLGGYPGSDTITDALIDECGKELERFSEPRFCGVLTEVSYREGNVIDLGFGEFVSKDLNKNLKGAGYAFVFCVTLGSVNERRLKTLSLTSNAKHYVFDALSSAYAEYCCDVCEKKLTEGRETYPRFSPGYGDLPLELQKPLLEYINAYRLSGITLSKSYLMTPCKSISAITGIKK